MLVIISRAHIDRLNIKELEITILNNLLRNDRGDLLAVRGIAVRDMLVSPAFKELIKIEFQQLIGTQFNIRALMFPCGSVSVPP